MNRFINFPEKIAEKYLSFSSSTKSTIGYVLIFSSIALASLGYFFVHERWEVAVLSALAFLLMYWASWLIWIRWRWLKKRESPPQLTYEQQMERANKEIEELNKQRPKEWG